MPLAIRFCRPQVEGVHRNCVYSHSASCDAGSFVVSQTFHRVVRSRCRGSPVITTPNSLGGAIIPRSIGPFRLLTKLGNRRRRDVRNRTGVKRLRAVAKLVAWVAHPDRPIALPNTSTCNLWFIGLLARRCKTGMHGGTNRVLPAVFSYGCERLAHRRTARRRRP